MRVADSTFLIALDVDGPLGIGHSLPARERDGAGNVIPGLMHLSMVAVEPLMWGRGVGKSIVSRLLADAEKRGFRSVQLWTQATNDRAKRLYKGEGFLETDREKVTDRGELIRLYAKSLDATS